MDSKKRYPGPGPPRPPVKKCAICAQAFSSPSWKCPKCGYQPMEKGGVISFTSPSALESETFPSSGFDRLAPLEAGNFWFRSRNRILLWAFQKYFPLAGSFFEIGCGNGFVLSAFEDRFPRVQMAGSEMFEQGLVYARQRLKRTALYQMDALAIPFQSEFDVLGAFDVLEHIPQDEQVLAQMREAVTPGGGILLTVPQHPFLWSYGDEFAKHARRYRAKELREKIERAGFEVVDAVSFVSLLLPLMLFSRLGQKKENYDPEGEF